MLLRRTNLVRMALSKYRHGGLLDAKVKRVGGTSNAPVQRIVDAEKFALGLRTYCIKQQAYAASIAAHVARTAGTQSGCAPAAGEASRVTTRQKALPSKSSPGARIPSKPSTGADAASAASTADG